MSTVQQLFGLDGKTALVTGGTRGIGQAMAIALAEAGADILLVQVGDTLSAAKAASADLMYSETNRIKRPRKPLRSWDARLRSTRQTSHRTSP